MHERGLFSCANFAKEVIDDLQMTNTNHQEKEQITMKKILYGLIAAVCFGIAATAGAAGQRCLNNDPNYPMSYGHANWWEYVDLSSIVGGAYDGEYYQFAVGYVLEYVNHGHDYQYEYRTRRFRTGMVNSLVQYYVEEKDKWVTIPIQDKQLVSEFIRKNGYAAYEDHFHPEAYRMFQIAYPDFCKSMYGNN